MLQIYDLHDPGLSICHWLRFFRSTYSQLTACPSNARNNTVKLMPFSPIFFSKGSWLFSQVFLCQFFKGHDIQKYQLFSKVLYTLTLIKATLVLTIKFKWHLNLSSTVKKAKRLRISMAQKIYSTFYANKYNI